MSFADLGLIPELLKAVEDAGYSEPTPIQSQAIPVVLEGRDVMGGAQTGTGKTAGFTLPLLNKISRWASSSTSPARHPVRALILTPTRELAVQVHEAVQTYAKYLPIRTVCLYGGVDIRPQIEDLRRGVEVVVATPGRLLDHIEQRSITLGQVEIVVLDEADRMLDMGFIPDIRRILGLLPSQRQSLLFSATFSEEIKRLADTMLRDPQLIEVAKRNTVSETITHRVYPVAAAVKKQLLVWLLREAEGGDQVLVFVSTKIECGRLSRHLQREGIAADAIHGDKSQMQRTEALEGFKSGAIRVLVATDVAARGLDIDDLPYVVNYELPGTAEDYIHRIGRTGRAGKHGNAVSLVSPDEHQKLAAIEKLIKLKIPQHTVPGFDADASPDSAYRVVRNQGADRRATSASHSASASHTTSASTSSTPRSPSAPRAPRSTVAPDGFDFARPYIEKETPDEADPSSALSALSDTPRTARENRPVAFLLGGRGR